MRLLLGFASVLILFQPVTVLAKDLCDLSLAELKSEAQRMRVRWELSNNLEPHNRPDLLAKQRLDDVNAEIARRNGKPAPAKTNLTPSQPGPRAEERALGAKPRAMSKIEHDIEVLDFKIMALEQKKSVLENEDQFFDEPNPEIAATEAAIKSAEEERTRLIRTQKLQAKPK